MAILRVIMSNLLDQKTAADATIRLNMRVGTIKVHQRKITFEQPKGADIKSRIS